MMTRANIETFVISQHSWGIGHLTRASTIAKAFSSISHVTLFSGGRPVEGYSAPSDVDFVQIPAIRRPIANEMPVPVDSRCSLAEIELMRSNLLVDSYRRIKPSIVIIEYFPFAPRRFGKTTLNELFNAIEKEQQRPIVVCSLRANPIVLPDIDADPASINEQLRKNFSCVLHHADPKFFPLTSFSPYIQTALSDISFWQTGFVRRPLNQMDRDRPPKGILLTVGAGSATGARLLKRWINAAKGGSPDLFPIHAVCGPLMDADDRKSVRAEGGANITVHDWASNMDELVSSSRAVVCMGGYNTLVESLSLKKPVLAFPVEEFGDQVFQVSALHAQGMLLKGDQSQSEREITVLMDKLLCFRPKYPIDYNGAERSVEIVQQLLSACGDLLLRND
jgi:predicted glycosyltransferase